MRRATEASYLFACSWSVHTTWLQDASWLNADSRELDSGGMRDACEDKCQVDARAMAGHCHSLGRDATDDDEILRLSSGQANT